MRKFAKIARFCYCLLFLSICAIPGISMLSGKQEDSTTEHRQPAQFPAFTNEDGSFNSKWSSQVQDYVSDHFGFRSQMVTADSLLKAKLLHTSAEDNVIIGSDGWLYYTATVDDFIGNPTVSDRGIHNIIRNLELMQAYVESRGGTFALTVIPNKNTVYPEFMPAFYRKSGVPDNLSRLTQALSESGIPYCDMALALSHAANNVDYPIYHKLDSHWNNTGALLGYNALLDSLHIPHQDFSAHTWKEEAVWKGDLQNMLFPDSDVLDIQHTYDIPFTYTYMGRYKDADDLNIDTMNPNGTGSLLMFRDSFGAAIIPYLSEHFMMAKYSRSRPYALYHLEASPSETVVVEIVERNISWLQKEAPMHPAMPAEQVPAASDSCNGTLFTTNNGTRYLHIYGTMEHPVNAETAPHYYVTITDSRGNSRSYQAYNCFETDLLGQASVEDNGYSLYIDSTQLDASDVFSVTVTANLGDTAYQCTFADVSFDAQSTVS